MEKINCPLFEKKTVLKNYINVKDYSNTQEEFTIVSCETTNFLFTNPRPKEKDNVEKSKRLEDVKIPDDFEFHKLHSISSEAKEKLSSINPKTIGQAKRISGVSPADVNVLLVYMGR